VNDHIAVGGLGVLDEQFDALRHVMAVFQIPVAWQGQVKINVVARP
jgi:hypothetical protein